MQKSVAHPLYVSVTATGLIFITCFIHVIQISDWKVSQVLKYSFLLARSPINGLMLKTKKRQICKKVKILRIFVTQGYIFILYAYVCVYI